MMREIHCRFKNRMLCNGNQACRVSANHVEKFQHQRREIYISCRQKIIARFHFVVTEQSFWHTQDDNDFRNCERIGGSFRCLKSLLAFLNVENKKSDKIVCPCRGKLSYHLISNGSNDKNSKENPLDEVLNP